MLFRGVPREHPVAFLQTCAKAAAVRYEGNLLLNENHPLHNQILQIRDTFKEQEKVNIENKKVNIEEDFTAKTASHVRKLQEALGKEIVFGSNRVEWMGNRGYFDLFPQSEVLRRLENLCTCII